VDGCLLDSQDFNVTESFIHSV